MRHVARYQRLREPAHALNLSVRKTERFGE
jgi:hypothetical protein